jgi:hypothetical protein
MGAVEPSPHGADADLFVSDSDDEVDGNTQPENLDELPTDDRISGDGDENDEHEIRVLEDIGLSVTIAQWKALTSEIRGKCRQWGKIQGISLSNIEVLLNRFE